MLVSLVAAALLAAASGPADQLVIITGGDDGLTLRLADAIREALGSTAPGLTVTIPAHIGWRMVHGRTRVSYKVELSTSGRTILSSGACWDDDLNQCARQIAAASAPLLAGRDAQTSRR